jgi:hypothetical protein
MFTLLFSLRDCLRSRAVLQAEILALRHQLLIFERSRPGHNLRLRWTDRALWVWLSRLSFRACGPRNLMKIAHSKIATARSSEVESTMEKLRPYDCLIRSVRD